MPLPHHANGTDSATLVTEVFPAAREVIFRCHSSSDLAVYQQLLVDTY